MSARAWVAERMEIVRRMEDEDGEDWSARFCDTVGARIATLEEERDKALTMLLDLMHQTDPADWPTRRGYGYSNDDIKSWHIGVVLEFVQRLSATGGAKMGKSEADPWDAIKNMNTRLREKNIRITDLETENKELREDNTYLMECADYAAWPLIIRLREALEKMDCSCLPTKPCPRCTVLQTEEQGDG